MKKLYRKSTVHPSPPGPIISDQLSFLPAAILTLTAALSPEDREVLAYLISCSSHNTAPSFINFSASSSGSGSSSSTNTNNPRRSTNKGAVGKGASGSGAGGGDHPPMFNCSCFRCYMSYWARWDSSPNQQLIHEIIDAYEDWLAQSKKGGKNRKERRNKKGGNNPSGELKNSESSSGNNELESVVETSNSAGDGGGEGGDSGRDENEEKGSVRRLVNFIGERIWGAWGQ